MTVRRLARGFVALATATLMPVAIAQAGAATAASAPIDARAWLSRIHGAASQRNYQGTLVHNAGGAMSSTRIAHYSEGQQTYERLDVLDGQQRQILRHNELVYTLWPNGKQAMVERREALMQFPALLQPGEEQLFERYELQAEGADRVAGHAALVFLLKPRDGARFAQRLWADRDTGLLLRTDVMGDNGRVLESSAFTEVTIGIKPQPESVLQAMKKLDGYQVMRPASARTKLASEGWQLAPPVAGFRQVSCVKRLIDGGAARSGADVLQAIFSDGLTHVSVFIEPFNPQRHKPVLVSIGATHTLMKQKGDWWVTVMGDVPMETARRFADALERRP